MRCDAHTARLQYCSKKTGISTVAESVSKKMADDVLRAYSFLKTVLLQLLIDTKMLPICKVEDVKNFFAYRKSAP